MVNTYRVKNLIDITIHNVASLFAIILTISLPDLNFIVQIVMSTLVGLSVLAYNMTKIIDWYEGWQEKRKSK